MTTKPSLYIVIVSVVLFGMFLQSAFGSPLPTEFEVVIPKRSLDLPVNQPEKPTAKTLGDSIGQITVVVGDQSCATVDLSGSGTRNSSGDVDILLGSPGQPGFCANEGARVTFLNRDGVEFAEEFVWHGGASVVLSNLAVKARSDGPPATATGSTLPAAQLSPTARPVVPASTLAPSSSTPARLPSTGEALSSSNVTAMLLIVFLASAVMLGGAILVRGFRRG